MIREPAPKADLNQIIRDTCFEVSIWIKCFANPHRSPDLSQMIHDPCLEVLICESSFQIGSAF